PVTITITGVPAGTEVLARGKPIGTAPGPVQLDHSTATIVLMFTADGYQADSRSITPDRDQTLDLLLKSKRGGRPPPPKPIKQPGKDDLAVPTF
nr:PEGA domain-containing protein [Deltaproteobacteria bacterium]